MKGEESLEQMATTCTFSSLPSPSPQEEPGVGGTGGGAFWRPFKFDAMSVFNMKYFQQKKEFFQFSVTLLMQLVFLALFFR